MSGTGTTSITVVVVDELDEVDKPAGSVEDEPHAATRTDEPVITTDTTTPRTHARTEKFMPPLAADLLPHHSIRISKPPVTLSLRKMEGF